MAKHRHGEVRDGELLVDEEVICDYADADKLRGLQFDSVRIVNKRKPADAVSSYLREQVLAPGYTREYVTADTANIFTGAPPSTEPAPKRERAKDTSPMAQAKLATTHLRVIDARKGRALLAADKLRAEVAKIDEQRDQFILTLDDKVIAILKAGGVL